MSASRKISIETTKAVAYDSPDHIQPHGTAVNNTASSRFNQKLFDYIPAARVRLLDFGCAGGGLVKSVIDQGGFAVGIEGSDYSKKRQRAEWATIPDYLFTSDATVPFQLFEERIDGVKDPLQFNVITGWEFFEHIATDSIPGVVENMLRHLAPGGVILASIATYADIVNGVVLHQTVHQKPWWVQTFARLGLQRQPIVERYFQFDMINGVPFGGWSFTIALTRNGEEPLDLPKLKSFCDKNVLTEIRKNLAWLARPKTLHHFAWVTKRKIEQRLGGREFV